MPANKNTQRTTRRSLSRLIPVALLATLALWVSVGFGPAARASLPTNTLSQPTLPRHTWQPNKGHAQPLENGPAVKPAPWFTTSPSDLFVIDPHWRSPNVRANTDATTFAQQEPSLAVNPNNHLNVVVAQKDERSASGPGTDTKEVWIDTSTDGGLTWPVQTRVPLPDTTQPHQSDPVLTFSDNNTVYLAVIGYGAPNDTASNHTLVARSLDGGLTWQNAVYLDQTLGGSDKEWMAVDTNALLSPFYHRVYVTWTNFAAGPQFIEKWSSDSGVTWNPPGGSNFVTVSFGAQDAGQFSMPVILPNGTVIATWNPGSSIAVGKSTDGGQSFINPNTTAVSLTGANTVPGANWRLNTIPSTAVNPSNGTIVTVWNDGRNGKADIYSTRSTDSGTTWSAAARVAHNVAGSSYQVEPWISVSPNGRFDVIWYDDRDFPSNLNTFHIYATHSTDNGATWTGPDEQVTDASTNLNVGIPTGAGWNGAAGDYIGVTSVNEGAYACWTDTRSGNQEDIYTSLYTAPVAGSPTATFTPSNTPTRTNTPTITLSPTRTNTFTVTRTNTPGPTFTSTATNSPSSTATNTPTGLDAFAHFETPGPITVTLNTKFTFDLKVNSGSNSITAAQSYLTFTNSILQLVDTGQPGCVITSVVTPDPATFDAVLQNETCNGPNPCTFRGHPPTNPGSFAFASGALANCPTGCTGDFRVAQASFCGTAVGDATLHWQFSPPAPIIRDTEVVDNNNNVVSNPALYRDYVVHVVNNPAMLVGHVTWQGRPAQPNALQQLPITLTLKAGATEVNYPSVTTDASGFFTVSVGSLANGTYSWRVKDPKYLANDGTLVLAGAQQTNAEMGFMRVGDADNNNVVNTSDFNILKNSFGKGVGDPGYDARADFNGDNIVNTTDFTLLKNNFGVAGDPPI